jgi:hypothetical protein
MKWFTLAFLCLIAAPTSAQTASAPAGPSTPMTPAPDDRAKQWLTLLDDKNYNDSYSQMATAAREKIAEGPWSEKLGAARQPLGAMATRTIKDVKLTKTLPGMRDGQYATVQFDSSFAHKAEATETVVLTSEKGGWSVISYTVS